MYILTLIYFIISWFCQLYRKTLISTAILFDNWNSLECSVVLHGAESGATEDTAALHGHLHFTHPKKNLLLLNFYKNLFLHIC